MRLRARLAIPLTLTFAVLSVVVVGLLALQDREARLEQAERDIGIAASVKAERAADEIDMRRDAVRFLAHATGKTEIAVMLVDDAHLRHALWEGNVLDIMAQETQTSFDSLFITGAGGREMYRYEGGVLVTDLARASAHADTPVWEALPTLPRDHVLVWLEEDRVRFAAPVLDLRGRVVGMVGGETSTTFITALEREHLYSRGFASTAGTLGGGAPIPDALVQGVSAPHVLDDGLVCVVPAFELQAPGQDPERWYAVSEAKLAPIHAAVLHNAVGLGLGAATTLFALIIVVFVVLDRALRPLHRLTAAVDQLQAGDGDASSVGSDELDELARKIRDRGREEAEARSKLDKFATLGSLSAGVAHEVNNPLAFMRCNSELLLQEVRTRLEVPGLPPEERELLQKSARTVQKNIDGIDRIARIVQSLRLLAKPSPERRVVDLAAVVQATVDLAGPKLRSLEGIEVELDPGLTTTGSPDTLGQVVLNLLLNAAEVAPAKGGRVWVRGRRIGGRIEIRVIDNGTGLPAGMRQKLFQPFATTKAHGTGLGLSISHRIVHEHDGDLRYEDRPGGGACFIVELPIREAPTPAQPAPAQAKTPA